MMPRHGELDEEHARVSATLPTGTVTFLFTDIEGSTRRWEENRQAMEAAVASHDQLVRSSIAKHGGFVFKSAGDSFCAAFATARSAVGAALDAQRSLFDQDFSAVGGLRVRMALHSGSAEERDADYLGPTVNRIARLMSLAHGGQVLVSASTRELLDGDARLAATYIDLGSHRLKDLASPEHVWQANANGLPSEFPALRSLDLLPNNLPIQVTTFCGRKEDVEELKSQLAAHRLVTLVGIGGIGKTRMAAHVGAEVLDRFPDGVWIADLAPITRTESVPSVVAQVLEVGEAQGPLVHESIVRSLRNRRLMLVLDSCEHILEAAASLADAIHRNCPDVRILATSRQALGVSGEKVIRLAALAIPERSEDLSIGDALQYGAMALFADRALLVDQAFRLNAVNAPVVAEICRRLDGIPLAIELAAARAKALSVPNLLQRLNERFKILTGGSRTALPRQKTLSALIDWSFDLLSPAERELFSRVAIFAGSFTLDASTAVCAGDGVDEGDMLDLMCSLVDKSLVLPNTDDRQERYRLLESPREYGREKLVASGSHDRFARRQADYYLGCAQKARAAFGSIALSEWLAALQPDIENFRATLEWAFGKGQDAVLGGGVASALEMLWWHGGVEAEGRRWIDLALLRIDASAHDDLTAKLQRTQALLTSRLLFS